MGLCLSSTTLLSTASAAALPPKEDCNRGTPTLPLTGGKSIFTSEIQKSKKSLTPIGATELPSTTLELAYVLVGRGVQNYTCASPSATPVALGAVANLYDATSLARLSSTALSALAPKAVYLPTPKKGSSLLGVPYIGHHFFDSAGTPVFTLDAAEGPADKRPIAYVGKKANVPAPANADKGPAKTGAVDWLFLEAKTDAAYAGKSVTIKQVYRVVTSGGVGGACTVAGVKSVEYATEYWLYK